MVRLAVALPDLGAKDGRVAQPRERHLEHALDLPPVRSEVHVVPDDADHRSDDEVGGARLRVVEQPEHLHRLGGQPDLFPRLAQRGLHARAVPLLDDAAGERELALVMRHARRLLGEEHVRPVVVRYRHQHRRRHQIAPVQRHPRPPAQPRVQQPAQAFEVQPPRGHAQAGRSRSCGNRRVECEGRQETECPPLGECGGHFWAPASGEQLPVASTLT